MKIGICGHINTETTLKVDAFPVEYQPNRFLSGGISTSASGVGLNITRALHLLGNDVRLMSVVGRDLLADLATASLQADGIITDFVLPLAAHTGQSVILYNPAGQRMIFADLQEIQQAQYPLARARQALEGCDLAIICNINYGRPLPALAKEMGLRIATDVHTIDRIDDDYNRDFMAASDVLLQSHEKLPTKPEQWIHAVWNAYGTPVVCIGMGGDGALLATYDDGAIVHCPAISTRPVVSTIGAGDALFSAFVHNWLRGVAPAEALRRAASFASYKIGVAGAASGFPTLAEWERLAAPSG
jgi:ribokinase